MGNLDWDAEGDAIVDALVDDGVSFSGAEVSQILESLKDVEASGGDVSKIRSETGLKILKGLFALNADFIDHTVTPEMIAEDYREGRAEHGVVPFEVDIEGHLEALQRHTQETYVAVAALSIGGTNIIAGEARISGTGDIDVGMLGFKEFEDLPYEKGEDFWQAVLPEGSFEIFKKAVEDGKLDLGSTIAHPVEDGCLRPGKYTCPELTDGSTKVEDSLGTFVGEHGIAAKEDIHMAISPNDTVTARCAYFELSREYADKLRGSLIIGTGANSYLDGWVTEFGDYSRFKPSYLDKEQPTAEKTVTIDHLVAGSKMGDTFKFAVSELFGADNATSIELQKLSNKAAGKLIFDLAYGNELELPESVDEYDRVFLKVLARKFVDRSVYYAVNMLKGITMDIDQDVVLFVDGSLITKNPQFLEAINTGLEGSRVELVFSELNVSGDGADAVKDNASLVGTFVYALAAKLLRESTTE